MFGIWEIEHGDCMLVYDPGEIGKTECLTCFLHQAKTRLSQEAPVEQVNGWLINDGLVYEEESSDEGDRVANISDSHLTHLEIGYDHEDGEYTVLAGDIRYSYWNSIIDALHQRKMLNDIDAASLLFQ